jgi:hypothetical protein
MDNLTKLQNIIKDSSLSDENKSFWNEKLSIKIPSKVIDSFLEYLEEKPDDLEWFTDFTKRKFTAIESGDKNALDKILKEEEERLNAIN